MAAKPGGGRGVLSALDGGFWVLVVLAAASMAAAVALRGPGALSEGASIVWHDLKLIVPQVLLGVSVGALFSIVVPKALIARHLGEQSGLGGLVKATVFGAVMPGGPVTSFPLVVALGRSGAAVGPLIAFLVGWAAIGLHRMMVWELPFMGGDFALLRFLSALPLPILSGLTATWLARRLPSIRPDFGPETGP